MYWITNLTHIRAELVHKTHIHHGVSQKPRAKYFWEAHELDRVWSIYTAEMARARSSDDRGHIAKDCPFFVNRLGLDRKQVTYGLGGRVS